jgi:integrase
VFSAPSGGHLHYHNWRKRFWLPAVARAGLAPLGVHELRHTAAAIMIDQNIREFELAKRMGHSNVSTTYNLYGHLYHDERDSDLAQKLDDVRGAYMARKLVNPG